MKKVILYCRSACGGPDKNSLDVQEQNLSKYAANRGYEIIDNQKIDAVIAANLSRYGRCRTDVYLVSEW